MLRCVERGKRVWVYLGNRLNSVQLNEALVALAIECEMVVSKRTRLCICVFVSICVCVCLWMSDWAWMAGMTAVSIKIVAFFMALKASVPPFMSLFKVCCACVLCVFTLRLDSKAAVDHPAFQR